MSRDFDEARAVMGLDPFPPGEEPAMYGKGLLAFDVVGEPRPQGSKTVHRSGSRTWVTEGKDAAEIAKLKSWRSEVKVDAMRAMAGLDPFVGPVELVIVFYFPFLSAHFGTGRNAGRLKDTAPRWKETTPDIDKLVRAVVDAMTSVVYRNDGQVASLLARKEYARLPITRINVRQL